jgi:hypothetical protein
MMLMIDKDGAVGGIRMVRETKIPRENLLQLRSYPPQTGMKEFIYSHINK